MQARTGGIWRASEVENRLSVSTEPAVEAPAQGSTTGRSAGAGGWVRRGGGARSWGTTSGHSFTNQVMAQIEMFGNTGQYETQVNTLSKALYEKVARLHLDALGVRLTELMPSQAEYLGVPVGGPYKSDHCRY